MRYFKLDRADYEELLCSLWVAPGLKGQYCKPPRKQLRETTLLRLHYVLVKEAKERGWAALSHQHSLHPTVELRYCWLHSRQHHLQQQMSDSILGDFEKAV
jgi:hypothetical protein